MDEKHTFYTGSSKKECVQILTLLTFTKQHGKKTSCVTSLMQLSPLFRCSPKNNWHSFQGRSHKHAKQFSTLQITQIPKCVAFFNSSLNDKKKQQGKKSYIQI